MKWSDFMVFVQPEVPGCPAFTAERAIRDAAIDLCRATDVWKDERQDLQIVPGVIEYDLPTGSGVEVNRVLDIQRDGVPLVKLTGIRDIYEKLGNDSQREKPNWYGADDNTGILVARRPAEAETLSLFMSLKPGPNSGDIPDTIGWEYRHQIANGAKSQLLMMAAQPWSNPQLAMVYDAKFRKDISGIIRQVKFGFAGASIRVNPRPFI